MCQCSPRNFTFKALLLDSEIGLLMASMIWKTWEYNTHYRTVNQWSQASENRNTKDNHEVICMGIDSK